MKLLTTLLVIAGSVVATGESSEARVIGLHQYESIYPASSSLGIPFHGSIKTLEPMDCEVGEYWFPVDHLVKSEYFKDIEVLVRHDGAILGARATFSGSEKEWKGERGIDARLKVIEVFVGGAEDFREKMADPSGLVFNERGDFGGMVYSFDLEGVSWRKARGREVSKNEYERLERLNRADDS